MIIRDQKFPPTLFRDFAGRAVAGRANRQVLAGLRIDVTRGQLAIDDVHLVARVLRRST